MTELRLRYQTFEIGSLDIHVRTLRDTQQFSDDDKVAEDLGISSASWPLFGVVWDSGRVLAELMVDFDVAGRRVLEVGCGIGLASLVLNRRSADITATDRHPEADKFLQANADLNGGPPIPFVRTNWRNLGSALTRFDLIIGSDLLYERGHAETLSTFIDGHAAPACEVVIVDPGRPQRGRFTRLMVALGYAPTSSEFTSTPAADAPGGPSPVHGRVLHYQR